MIITYLNNNGKLIILIGGGVKIGKLINKVVHLIN